jgi:gliding motility-associated-like protein
LNNTATTLYTFTPTTGQCASTQTLNVTVNYVSVEAGSNSSLGSCLSSIAILSGTATGNGPLTYSWTPLTGLSSPNIASPVTASPSVTTVYTLTVTDANNCSNSDFVTVSVSPLPIANAGADASIGVCLASTAVLDGSATGVGPFTYQWSPATGLNQSNIPNPVAHPTSSTATIYTLMVTDAYGCTATDDMTLSVNVFDESVLHFTTTPKHGCEPLLVNFSFNPNNEVVPNSWVWNFGDANSQVNSSTDQNTSHLFENSGNYIVTLTVTTLYGCTASFSDTVKVRRKPIAEFTNTPEVGSTENPRIEFFDQSLYANTWSWSFGDPNAINHDTSDLMNPVHIFSDSGVYLVTLVVSNSYGCNDTATRYIRISEEFTFYIPNAFTPNGDGHNESFKPVGTGYSLKNYEMFVFDRWGKKIFSTKDINTGWDGIDDKDKLSEQGIYAYLIFITQDDGIKRVFKGVVTLVE